MNRTPRNEAVHEVFEAADKAFAAADEAFAKADRVFDSIPVTPLPKGMHRVRFTATNWKERPKLVWRFAKMAGAVLFTGKVIFTFKT